MVVNAGHFSRRIPEHKRHEVARLLSEGCSHRGIEKRTGVSRSTVAYLAKQPDVQERSRLEKRRALGREAKAARRRLEERVEFELEKGRVFGQIEEAHARATAAQRMHPGRYEDFLNRNDLERASCARNKAMDRDPCGHVLVKWPGGQCSYDPTDEEDVEAKVDVIAHFCSDLSRDTIRTRLVCANTMNYGAVVINSVAARKTRGLPVDWMGNPRDT